MNPLPRPRLIPIAISLSLLLVVSGWVEAYSPNPNLTAAGAIAALKVDPNSSPQYGESYNLGPTGLRGWIYLNRPNKGQEGLITDESRQILVTVVGTDAPATGVLAVDDVILGVKAGSGPALTLPTDAFTSDCRKAFGWAITEAETTANAGVMRLLRWRAGSTSTVSITLLPPDYLTNGHLGTYVETAPYSCLKSARILANAITRLNEQSLSGGWNDAVSALALLAAVKPGDANYAAVQTKLRNYARAKAPGDLSLSGCDTWNWGYLGVFLSEYYLRTVADGSPDASVLHGIEEYTVGLAKGQSKYGTFGHGGAAPLADGSLHGSISWYGPVNSAGLVANIAIILGKEALMAGGIALDPEIDPAIERGSNFFAYFVNKGGVPYGEHEPWSGGHASNGKDAMAAVMYALQDSRAEETEYYTRMSTAGFVGREYGHTGQGFSYLWAALGAGMGGDAAATAHVNQVLWHLDLERRTDGSFVYDGGEQYGGSSTSTYSGSSSYYGLNATACHVLTYALPLKRLRITGRNANPAHTLDAGKVANAIAAATYERDCTGYPVATLMAALSEYDPVMRHDAAAELASRPLSTGEVNDLIALIDDSTLSPDANVRQGACETLGIRKTTGALTALGQRLSDADLWVRGKAANALKEFGSAAGPELTAMLTAFAANATDPDVIVWDDPIQIANGYLADTLFQALGSQTIAASKDLLYPAVEAGLKQPDGRARGYLGNFIKNRLTFADVEAVAPSLVGAVAERSPADQMFSDGIRYAGLETLAKYKIEEGIPLCLMVKEQTWHGDDWKPFEILRNTYGTAAKEVLPTLYDWRDNLPVFEADGSISETRYDNIEANITSTIAALEAATPPPALTYFKTVDIVSSTRLDLDSVQLSAVATDLDDGVPGYVWSQVSGPGTVTFSPNGTTASSTTVATFDTPGTYVVRAAVTDRSIMDEVTWWKPHRQLGYYDFQTYDHNYGQAWSGEESIVIDPGANWPPVAYAQDVVTAVDTVRALTLIGFDYDGDALSFSIVTPPAHGTLSGTAPDVSYTPASGYGGSDSFTFEVMDSKGASSAVATVSIAVQNLLSLHVTLDNSVASGLVGPVGGLGETWNQPLAKSGSGLLDSDGLVTGVSFSCSASNLGQWGSPPLKMLRGGAFNWGANDAYALRISGLATGQKYDLSLAGFHPNEDGGKALFSTGNTTDTGSPQIVDNGGANGNSSTWVEGVNYARFLNVEPDESGDIDLTIDGDTTTGNRRRAYLSGFQLQAVPPTPPVPPSGLAAAPGDAQVGLSWNAAPGAHSYLVKRASVPGGPYSTRANPATTHFLDAPAGNGTTWYYVVSTVDVYGEGPDSAEVSATPVELVAPAAPDGLAATAGDAVVELSWDAPALATSYQVKRATNPGGPYSLIASPAATSYLDSNVLNGLRYYYVVSAVNSAGESADSEEATALPLLVTLVLSVNIDSVTRTGLVGPAGGLGTVWNQVGKSGSMSQAVDLLDTAGEPSGIGYQFDAPGNLDNWGAPGGLLMLANSVYNGTWGKITGLATGGAYHLYIASYYKNEQGSKGDFVTTNATSNGASQSVDNGWPAITTNNYNSGTWVEGENHVVFRDIVADEDGEINLTMIRATDGGRNPKLMVSGFQLEEIGSESVSPFRSWAEDPAQGLTAGVNDGPLDDPDLDGLLNLMEFVLRGNPLVPASATLPTVSPSGEAWVFDYERSNLSEPPATTQVVEYGSDLVGWTPVSIPLTSAGIVTITPGSPSDHVSVALPNLGSTGFARLRVSE